MGFAPGPLIRRYGPVRNCFTLHVYIKQESTLAIINHLFLGLDVHQEH